MSQNHKQNRSKQATTALLAIITHALEHDLSAPWSIDVSPSDSAIRLRLLGAEHQAWLNTLVVLGEDNETHDRAGWVRTAWEVQLPVGVVFHIVTYRELPMLSVVPA